MTSAVHGLLAIALLYWLPGAALCEILWPDLRRDPRHDGLSRFAIAAAASLAVPPLFVLWCRTLGIPALPWAAWAPGAAGALVLLGRAAVRRRAAPHARRSAGPGAVDLALAAILVLTAASRYAAVRDLVLPAWGDSVQHSVLTQLLLDHRGLFESWAPYAPMESLTYHFGFHATAACFASITGASAQRAVLAVGQITGVVAVLALYPLTLQLTGGSRPAGAAALLVGGLLSPMPAFYASWGRYTQLAGQALLPVVVTLLDATWLDRRRLPPRSSVLLALLLAGLFLTHYRVTLLAATAAAVWAAAGAWRWRGVAPEWRRRALFFAAATVLALVAAAPWIAVLNDGLLVHAHRRIAAVDPSVFSFDDVVRAWSSIPTRVPWLLAAAVAAALAVGVLVRDRAVVLVVAWSAVAALVTNPFVLGLPGMGFVTNFALAIAAYVPAAVLVGWAVARAAPWIGSHRFGLPALAVAFLIAATAGFVERAAPVPPEFQLATEADLRAFDWIRENVATDAHFLVDAALGYGGETAVGTDAGWWLPLLARRSSTLPPLPYAVERMNEKRRRQVWLVPQWIERTWAWPYLFHNALCHQGVTHVFLAAKRGSTGPRGGPLLREDALRTDPAMTLLYDEGGAQVWAFDGSLCPH